MLFFGLDREGYDCYIIYSGEGEPIFMRHDEAL